MQVDLEIEGKRRRERGSDRPGVGRIEWLSARVTRVQAGAERKRNRADREKIKKRKRKAYLKGKKNEAEVGRVNSLWTRPLHLRGFRF